MSTVNDSSATNDNTSTRLRAALANLAAKDGDDPDRYEDALGELQRLELETGNYQAASQIEDWLRSSRSKNLEHHARQQIYDIVSAFHHHHILEEIRAGGQDPDSLGPTLIAGFMSDLIQSTFSGSAPREGFERFISSVDALYGEALAAPRQCQHFLNLCLVSIDLAIELYAARLEQEQKGFNRAARYSRRNETPAPRKRSTLRVIDTNVVRYLQDVQQRLRALTQQLGNCAAAEKFENIFNVAKIADTIRMVGFSARAKKEIGFAYRQSEPQRAGEYLLSSAKDFELQADVYKLYDLPNLQIGELESAERIYEALGEAAGLKRVRLMKSAIQSIQFSSIKDGLPQV